MKKLLKSLIVMTFCLSMLGSLFASTSTANTCDYNKTYLNPRSAGTNLALLHGAGICGLVNRVDEKKFGGTLQGIFFYQNKDHDAQYWTPWNQNCFELLESEKTGNFFPNYVNGLDSTSGAATPILTDIGSDTKISFDPEQTTYGLMLAYDQRMDKLLRGLYFRVQVPIVHVENELNFKVEGTGKDEFAKFIAGKEAPGEVANLKYAKIEGCGTDSTTGIADIDVLLGYTFLNKRKCRASVNFGITFPTGTEAEGKILNEAIIGNGQHFGLGGGLTFDVNLWDCRNHKVWFDVELKYRYLFEASEYRTLGIKNVAWGHYLPLYKDGSKTTFEDVVALNSTPAANVTTLNVDVTPGHEFDGVAILSYSFKGFSANLGYNFYYREAEDVDLKCACNENPFDTDTYYYISAIDEATKKVPTFTALTKDDLMTNIAKTCVQTTHKIFGGLAYTFKDWETPINLGIGGHYEFADGRRANEGWGINGRAAIGF